MKKILILAGGFGTRLKSLVSDVPKPLAPVDKKPFIHYLILNLIHQGADDIVLLLHYESNQIKEAIKNLNYKKKYPHLNIRFIVESEPLGTGGSVLNAINALDIRESFLVINADTWLGSGLQLINHSKICSIAAIWVQDSTRYGTLKILDNKIIGFSEKDTNIEEGWINAGLYHIHPKYFEKYLSHKKFSLEKVILPKIAEDGNLYSIFLDTDFIDIGIPEDFLKFCRWIKGDKNALKS